MSKCLPTEEPDLTDRWLLGIRGNEISSIALVSAHGRFCLEQLTRVARSFEWILISDHSPHFEWVVRMTQREQLQQLAHPLMQATCVIIQSLFGKRKTPTLPVERITSLATAAHRLSQWAVTVSQLFILNNPRRLTAFANLDHNLQRKRLQIELARISTSLLQFCLQGWNPEMGEKERRFKAAFSQRGRRDSI